MKKTLDKEFAVGTSPIADVVLATDIDLLEEYKTYQRLLSFPDIERKDFYSQITDKDNCYFPTKMINLVLFCHNNASEKIKSWNDLKKESLKNKVVLPLPVNYPAIALEYFLLYNNPNFGLIFFNSLKDNNCVFLNNPASCLNSVLLEKAYYGLHYDHVIVRAILKDQLPLKVIYPLEGVIALTEPMAVFKGTKNEKIARHLIEFILSLEGQKIITENGYLSVRKDILSPLGFPSTKDIKFLEFDKSALSNLSKKFPKELKDFFEINSLVTP